MESNITQHPLLYSPQQSSPLFPNAHIVAALPLLLVAVFFHFIAQLISIASWKTAIRLGLQEARAPPDYYPYEHGIAVADVLLGCTYPIAVIGLFQNARCTYPIAVIGLFQNAIWAYKLAFIPAAVLLYHGLSFWFWDADRRAAGHQLCINTMRYLWCFANFATGLFTLLVAWMGPSASVIITRKPVSLTPLSSFIRNLLISIIFLYVLFLAVWQSSVLSGWSMKNPDGSVDSWASQKSHYGIAFADLYFLLPVCVAAEISVFIAPRWGYFGFSVIAFLFMWANIMTTTTSLRFEKPKFKLDWFITFPFGILLGFAYLSWIIIHFDSLLAI